MMLKTSVTLLSCLLTSSLFAESAAYTFMSELDQYCATQGESPCRGKLDSFDINVLDIDQRIGLADMYISLDFLFSLDQNQQAVDRRKAVSIVQKILVDNRRNKLALRTMSGATDDDLWEGLGYMFELLQYYPDSGDDHLSAGIVLGGMSEDNIIAREKYHFERAILLADSPNKGSRAIYFYRSLIRRGREKDAEAYKMKFSASIDHESEAEKYVDAWSSMESGLKVDKMRKALRGYCFGGHISLVGTGECKFTISSIEASFDDVSHHSGLVEWLADSYSKLKELEGLNLDEEERMNELWALNKLPE